MSEDEDKKVRIISSDDAPYDYAGAPLFPHERARAMARMNGHDREPSKPMPQSRLLDLRVLELNEPPEFKWHIPGWLSPHPTLLSGRGGVGKSLLALQLACGLAVGRPLIGGQCKPLRVLAWLCEDDVDEIHRRLAAITASMGISFSDLDEKLYIDARLGLDNVLLGSAFGQPAWSANIELLREQVNDLNVDVLILDNIAHVYTAGENDRSAVTMFTSGLAGLILHRPWCPWLVGHVAKAAGSEYAGSTAWENAVRMRWYLGKDLPDAKPEDDEPADDNIRILAKRKSNYSSDDVIKLTVQGRVFSLYEAIRDDGTVVGAIRQKDARETVLDGLVALAEMGMNVSEKRGPNHLPSMLIKCGLAGKNKKEELEKAMFALIGAKEICRTVTGKHANRKAQYGLVLTANNSANNGANNY